MLFYLRYLKAELLRRLSKTTTISLGLAMASAIIIIIISVSQSLSDAQKSVLNPLENVGTDLMVTRTVNTESAGKLDSSALQELMSENRFGTDLSKLGNAGESFSTDSFMSSSLLSFEATQSAALDSSLVKDSAAGLILNAVHQEGKVPEIIAEFETGGETYNLEQEIDPMTDEERVAVEAAREAAMEELRAKGIDPRSQEGRAYLRKAENAAMPERLSKMTMTFTAPKQTFRQQIDAPQTDIQTENYTIGGVDTEKTDIGLILPNQITEGSYFSGEKQAIINTTYAQKKTIAVGSTIKIAGTDFAVVGLVEPKLYTNVADIYLPLSELQTLSDKEGKINILLLQSNDAFSVEETAEKIGSAFPGATVTTADETVKQVTGSLVSAAGLMQKFTGIVSIIIIVSAFAIVSLLTLLSMNKRGREIGILKALGWKSSTVIRQVFMENICLGFIGAVLGIGIAAGCIYLLNRFDISLSATIGNAATNMMRGGFGPIAGNVNQSAQVSADVTLSLRYSLTIFALGTAVAFLGSVISGGLAAIKSMRLRPQEAIRQLE